MSRRLRSTPWWEDCATLGHAPLEIEGPVNPADPDGVFFARCAHCAEAAKRRRRLAQTRIVIILDPWPPRIINFFPLVRQPGDVWWLNNHDFFKTTLFP
jgi:hypothetical protein